MKIRTQFLFPLTVAVLAMSLDGCGDESRGHYYQAICSQMHGIVRGWEGPRREDRADALHDAEGHKSSYPDHTVTIEEHR
jgi:hypothetical protein